MNEETNEVYLYFQWIYTLRFNNQMITGGSMSVRIVNAPPMGNKYVALWSSVHSGPIAKSIGYDSGRPSKVWRIQNVSFLLMAIWHRRWTSEMPESPYLGRAACFRVACMAEGELDRIGEGQALVHHLTNSANQLIANRFGCKELGFHWFLE